MWASARAVRPTVSPQGGADSERKGCHPMETHEYREVIGVFLELAREQDLELGSEDFDGDYSQKEDLLVLLRRLRQALFLRSRRAVMMTASRFSDVLEGDVSPFVQIDADRSATARLGVEERAFFEGASVADQAIDSLDELIRDLENESDNGREMTY